MQKTRQKVQEILSQNIQSKAFYSKVSVKNAKLAAKVQLMKLKQVFFFLFPLKFTMHFIFNRIAWCLLMYMAPNHLYQFNFFKYPALLSTSIVWKNFSIIDHFTIDSCNYDYYTFP